MEKNVNLIVILLVNIALFSTIGALPIVLLLQSIPKEFFELTASQLFNILANKVNELSVLKLIKLSVYSCAVLAWILFLFWAFYHLNDLLQKKMMRSA